MLTVQALVCIIQRNNSLEGDSIGEGEGRPRRQLSFHQKVENCYHGTECSTLHLFVVLCSLGWYCDIGVDLARLAGGEMMLC